MATATARDEMPRWMAKGLEELWAYLKKSEEERLKWEEKWRRREEEWRKREEELRRKEEEEWRRREEERRKKEEEQRRKEEEEWRRREEERRRKREEEQKLKQREWEERFQRLENLFTTQWGKLVEALVEPGSVDLFRKRGIKIRQSARRVEIEDDNGRVIAEYDILLDNDDEVVVIEVKTTVTKEDVDYLLEKLSRFKERSPKYRDYTVYGAIAGITYNEGVDRYAYKRGLFVLKSEGGVINIANDEEFKPKSW